MSFGTLHTLFRGLSSNKKKIIAEKYGISDTVLLSWIGSINVIRNICAHHGRMFNRTLGFKPMIPKKRKHPQWHTPVSIDNSKIFSVLTILQYIIKITAPRSEWALRLKRLLTSYGELPPRIMGFPESWEDHEMWKEI